MGWSSIDDFVDEVTVQGKFCRTDWQKSYTQAAATASRWYDLSLSPGNPEPFGYNYLTPFCGGYGELVRNGGFLGGSATQCNGWTLADAGWVWAANTMTHVGAIGVGTLTQNAMQKTIVAGRSYRVSTMVSALAGVGNIGVSIGGTAGVAIAASGATPNVQIIGPVAGAGVLTYTPSNIGLTCTITYITVVELLQAFPMDDTLQGAMFHGGNVSAETKHLLNAGVMTNTATTAPSTLILVDLLMCYPGISLASALLPNPQVFLNAVGNTLPRYTDGVGVKAFLVTNVLAGAATPDLFLTYTNTTADSTRTLLNSTLLLTASPVQHITHSGALAGNQNPFLPLQSGDLGIVNAVNITITPTMTSGEACLVLCKPLATIPITTALAEAERDLFSQLPSLPRIVDGACLGLIVCAGAAIPNPGVFTGYFEFGWG